MIRWHWVAWIVWRKRAFRRSAPRHTRRRWRQAKSFGKNLMRKYGIPTAKCEIFTEMDKALAYLDTQEAPIVVKADGLALGKGVVVAATIKEAKNAVIEMMEGGKFGRSGARVLNLRNVWSGARLYGAVLLRRKDDPSDACEPGSQARIRRGQGSEYRRHGRVCAEPAVYGGNRRAGRKRRS